MKIICELECGHSLPWGEDPFSPDADIPWKGRVVYCTKCEKEQEIIECVPSYIDIDHIQLSPNKPTQTSVGYTPGDRAVIFFDLDIGQWGYCFYGISNTGLSYDGDNIPGFASQSDAEDAMRERYSVDL